MPERAVVLSIRMTPLHGPWITTALVTAFALAACSGTPRQSVQAAPQPAPGYAYTDADVRFMSGMIGHHAQALVMAGWAPTHGAGPSLRTLAERIINAQQDEIATMQQWLRDRNQPVPEVRAAGMKMMVNGAEHEMLMPGMLTEAQMKQLDEAKGPGFDRQFLTFMIQHHRGAVTMVTDLFGSNGAARDETVFKFASDVNVDQSTEIARMEKMLAAVPAE